MSVLSDYPDTYDDDDRDDITGCAAESEEDMKRGDVAEARVNALLGKWNDDVLAMEIPAKVNARKAS